MRNWFPVFGLFLMSCSSLTHHALKPVGRYLIKGKQVELISPASHVGFSFEGAACTVPLSLPDKNAHSYIQYELDGVYKGRFRISSSEQLLINSPGNGRHTVWLYKTTESHSGSIMVGEVKGDKVRPLPPPSLPIIEFIGNSITCGAAADASEVPCGKGEYHDQHNAYFAYGPRVARMIGAEFIMNSVSGIGIYRTWNQENPSMPMVYRNSHFNVDPDKAWNVSDYSPKVISIALGTNDLSRGDGVTPRSPFDSTKFVHDYIAFVNMIKQLHPLARIALLSSPMLNGRDRELLQNCISAVKLEVDKAYPAAIPVALHFFRPMTARGCTGHPSVEDHAILADELKPFFAELIK